MADTQTIRTGIGTGAARFIEQLVNEAGDVQKRGPVAVLCGGDTREERIAGFRNWAVTYLIAHMLIEAGMEDESVNDYSLRLVTADGEEVDA